MDNDEELIAKVARKAAEETIEKLMEKNMIKLSSRTAYEKTFRLLQRYNQLSLSDSPDTLKQVAQIDTALDQIKGDPYYAIIPMFFFENVKLENIAEHFDVSIKTIRRSRKTLIDYIAAILFSDDVIMDILS